MYIRASKIKPFNIMSSQLAKFSLRYSIEGILELDDRVAVSIVEDAVIKVDFPCQAGKIIDTALGSTSLPKTPCLTNEILTAINTNIAMTNVPLYKLDTASLLVS